MLLLARFEVFARVCFLETLAIFRFFFPSFFLSLCAATKAELDAAANESTNSKASHTIEHTSRLEPQSHPRLDNSTAPSPLVPHTTSLLATHTRLLPRALPSSLHRALLSFRFLCSSSLLSSFAMGERKVLNKYYDPDFDPALLPKTIKPKNNQVTVRLMLPMSIQCQNCGEYIHKGKKFNGRKEEAVGEAYLGIKVWRFYLKCTTCLSELTFKTDPKRNDYTVEHGASRNFEPWKIRNVEEELEKAKKEREEMGDNMKVLENRTEASKREMDLQDAIEEVKELNARAAALTTDQLLDIHSGGAARWEEAQIEEMAARAFAQKKNNNNASNGYSSNGISNGIANGNGSKPAPPMPDSSATFAAAESNNATAASASALSPSSAAAAGASSSSDAVPASLRILKRLPDAVDLAAVDFRPAGGASTLDQLEVPDSPTSSSSATCRSARWAYTHSSASAASPSSQCWPAGPPTC